VTILGLSSEQVQRFLSLLEVPKQGGDRLSGMVTWMFGSGTSCHMTGNAKELHNVKQIIPVPIGLPNGTHIMASHRGILSLENELHLAYVLYVHTLKCNLISIAQLCKDMHCTVTFSDYVCISQDHTIRTPIGAGEQCGGIYYYKQGSLGKIQANAITIDNLWHKRLEHNSNQVLACLRKNLAISSQKNDVREICT